jgi:hypothetical protein
VEYDWEWLAMSDPRNAYQEWIARYQEAWRSPSSVSYMSCPSCGERSLRLIFVVELADAESGTAIFWCESCLRGLMPMRAPLPDGGHRTLKGFEVVPNYSLIIDGSTTS